ncbi:nucleotide-binding universal stress UspA family protein [Rubrivivax gelatinosus]|uniref:universal stress protein n=2 Tax=Rubrivivax gelatinosus TaxID=28068 RepID=UPI0018CB3248|nr:universal stress protein [Rubrivivax gelatinosus]MBG6078996.1 nucleotide-binding universal stress UspA family protein [Rubrivivax gelatinosus]
MHPTAPVIAATDFSPQARQAAERAARLAHETGAPLALVHVLPGDALEALRAWLGSDTAPVRAMRDEAEAALAAQAAELKTRRRVEPAAVCATGPVLDEILREAEARDAGLLVLGARGNGFLRRLVLGSTAERLMRRSARPLLVVRQAPHEAYRRALVAVDFSPWSAPALALAHRVAPHAQLVLLAAYEVPFGEKLRYAGVDEATVERYREAARLEATRRVHALAEACGLRAAQWTAHIVEGDASLRIVEQEAELGCDLVVLGKHGRAAGVDLLLGSTTRHVLAEGSSDVLVSTARD